MRRISHLRSTYLSLVALLIALLGTGLANGVAQAMPGVPATTDGALADVFQAPNRMFLPVIATNTQGALANAAALQCTSSAFQTWITQINGVNTLVVRMTNTGVIHNGNTWVGQLTFPGNPTPKLAYCTDFGNPAPGGKTYCLDNTVFSDWRVAYLMDQFSTPATTVVEQAARQAAIWKFSDNWDLNAADPVLDGPGTANPWRATPSTWPLRAAA